MALRLGRMDGQLDTFVVVSIVTVVTGVTVGLFCYATVAPVTLNHAGKAKSCFLMAVYVLQLQLLITKLQKFFFNFF